MLKHVGTGAIGCPFTLLITYGSEQVTLIPPNLSYD
jgi:hypothetical protein